VAALSPALSVEFVPIELSAAFPIRVSPEHTKTDAPIRFLHVHDCLEMGYCHEGSGILMADEKVLSFRGGDMTFIKHTEVHFSASATGFVFSDVLQNLDGGDAVAQRVDHRAHHEAGVRGSQAEVWAESEGDVRVGTAVQPDFVGRVENGRVEVGRGKRNRGEVAGGDFHAVDLGAHRAFAGEVGDGGEHPEKLLARADVAFAVHAHEVEVGGFLGEVAMMPVRELMTVSRPPANMMLQ
jgi:AraC-like ligand binding domain